MYVKTVIYNEQNKLLLLKEKREDDKNRWDLPGATFTEEQSFDETVITNVQKEIGYYVYPGKIIGIGDYTSKTDKEVHVIMEGSILNGELLLSKDYETYNWVKLDRIKEYP
jgi:ADP-ribose pyrophosphatase YjhB (NUDIX family)